MYSSDLSAREFNTGTLINTFGIEYYLATNTNGNESETFSIREEGHTSGNGNFYGNYNLKSGSYDNGSYTLDAAIYIATLDTYYGITYTGDDDDNIASVDEISFTNPVVKALVQLGSDNDPCNYQTSLDITETSLSLTNKFIDCEVTITGADSDGNNHTYKSYLNYKSLELSIDFEDLIEGENASLLSNYIETELINIESLHVGYLKIYYNGSFQVTDLDKEFAVIYCLQVFL